MKAFYREDHVELIFSKSCHAKISLFGNWMDLDKEAREELFSFVDSVNDWIRDHQPVAMAGEQWPPQKSRSS